MAHVKLDSYLDSAEKALPFNGLTDFQALCIHAHGVQTGDDGRGAQIIVMLFASAVQRLLKERKTAAPPPPVTPPECAL